MRIHHVVPHIHEEASGPSYSVTSLCRWQDLEGMQVALHVLAPRAERPMSFPVHEHASQSFLRRLGISPSMRRGLVAAARQAEILHSHSLWMMPNVYPAWAARKTSAKLVVAPRGTLEPWSLQRSRWRKRVMWRVAQKAAVERANCLHVTSASELQSVRAAGLRNPVAIISNGVDIPTLQHLEKHPQEKRRLLYLGRIHPKKGLDMLLQAWAMVERQHSDWELRVVGRDQDGYRAQLQRMARELGLNSVTFHQPVYGAQKSAEYQRAELFVLPTRSENFGMVIAEALAHATPVICSKGAPWPELARRGCGQWIDIGVEPLARSLQAMFACSPSQLAVQGAKGRSWMAEDYSWSEIARQTRELYEWILGGGAMPAFVDAERTQKAA